MLVPPLLIFCLLCALSILGVVLGANKYEADTRARAESAATDWVSIATPVNVVGSIAIAATARAACAMEGSEKQLTGQGFIYSSQRGRQMQMRQRVSSISCMSISSSCRQPGITVGSSATPATTATGWDMWPPAS